MLKVIRTIKCKTMVRLIRRMTGPRYFTVHLGGEISRTRMNKNGVTQGSVMAPSLFNIYAGEILRTQSMKFIYADDLAVASQARTICEIERTLEGDCGVISDFFAWWYLSVNTSKSASSLFHLNNHEANRQLSIKINNV